MTNEINQHTPYYHQSLRVPQKLFGLHSIVSPPNAFLVSTLKTLGTDLLIWLVDWFLHSGYTFGSSHWGSMETNLTNIHEDAASIPSLYQWVKDTALRWAVVLSWRHGLNPKLLWLWCRPAATAPIRPLVWEPPYAANVALKRQKEKKKKEKIYLWTSAICSAVF